MVHNLVGFNLNGVRLGLSGNGVDHMLHEAAEISCEPLPHLHNLLLLLVKGHVLEFNEKAFQGKLVDMDSSKYFLL
jgi:hypothetical protein